jgi:hypothetical protein
MDISKAVILEGAHYAVLPDGWEEVSRNSALKENELEQAAGSGLKLSDLGADDIRWDEKNEIFIPKSVRAHYLHDAYWVKLRNDRLNMTINIRFQDDWDAFQHTSISAVVVPSALDKHLSSADLRKIPLAAIENAYRVEQSSFRVALNRREIISKNNTNDYEKILKSMDMRKPLPKNLKPRSREFLALVGIQYDFLNRQDDIENPVVSMSEINETAISNVQRWLSNARKLSLLAPSPRGRHIK